MSLGELEYQWLCLKYDSIRIADYFNDAESIAIYGMGELGVLLSKELKGDVPNLFGIDRNARGIIADIPVYTLDSMPFEPEYIVIALANDTMIVRESLEKKYNCKIVTLEEVLYNL